MGARKWGNAVPDQRDALAEHLKALTDALVAKGMLTESEARPSEKPRAIPRKAKLGLPAA